MWISQLWCRWWLWRQRQQQHSQRRRCSCCCLRRRWQTSPTIRYWSCFRLYICDKCDILLNLINCINLTTTTTTIQADFQQHRWQTLQFNGYCSFFFSLFKFQLDIMFPFTKWNAKEKSIWNGDYCRKITFMYINLTQFIAFHIELDTFEYSLLVINRFTIENECSLMWEQIVRHINSSEGYFHVFFFSSS